MTRELTRDAAQLFEAARREQPSQSARERALGLYAAAAPRASRARARRWAVVACVAAACGVGLFWWRSSAGVPAPFIRAEPRAAADSATHTAPAVPPRTSAAEPAPSLQAPPRALRSVAPKSSAPAPASSADLAAELALLDQARAALAAGDARGALAQLDRHQRLPTRALSAEATLLRIQTLSAMGSSSEASALARAFVGNNPNSPLSDRARHFIEGQSSAPTPGKKP